MRKMLFAAFLLVSLACAAYAELGLEVRAFAAIGYTIADVETASGEDGVTLDDWGQFYVGAHTQVLYRLSDKMQVGGEIGYQYLFWYTYTAPYPPYTIYRGFDVEAFNISGVLEYKLNDAMAVMGGPGVYIYDDGTAFGLFAAFTY